MPCPCAPALVASNRNALPGTSRHRPSGQSPFQRQWTDDPDPINVSPPHPIGRYASTSFCVDSPCCSKQEKMMKMTFSSKSLVSQMMMAIGLGIGVFSWSSNVMAEPNQSFRCERLAQEMKAENQRLATGVCSSRGNQRLCHEARDSLRKAQEDYDRYCRGGGLPDDIFKQFDKPHLQQWGHFHRH